MFIQMLVANVVASTMEFDMSVSMDDAEQLVRSTIDKVKLPETAEKPEIILSGPESDPTVFSMGIYGEENHAEVQKFVEDKIIPRLEVIEGVSKVDVGGVEDETVSIRLFPDELMKRGLTLDDVKATILANHFSIPTGDLSLSNEVFPVRVSKELGSLEDVKNIRLFTQEPASAEGLPKLEV